MNDKEFLQWIYCRLAEVHGENKNYDYMHRLKEIIDATDVVQKSSDIHSVSECDHDYEEDVACGVNLWVCTKCGDTN